MASAGSQSEGCRLQTGGRRVTAGAAGCGRNSKQQTDGEEEIGGEIEYAWAMCLGGKGTRVNLVEGEGRPEPSFDDGKSST